MEYRKIERLIKIVCASTFAGGKWLLKVGGEGGNSPYLPLHGMTGSWFNVDLSVLYSFSPFITGFTYILWSV